MVRLNKMWKTKTVSSRAARSRHRFRVAGEQPIRRFLSTFVAISFLFSDAGHARLSGQDSDSADGYCAIQVVDSETKRGVPMVRLTTVDGTEYFTDSAGWIAFQEPGLFGRRVFFHVDSHGYAYPKDGFGYRGTTLKIEKGRSAKLEIDRVNIAERMYRVTGRGIYRDSVLLGKKPPIAQPLLNGKVVGQDTVQAVVYRGKIHWFWGDTNRPRYPLGQFKTSGATSRLPGESTWNVARGVELEYFVDEKGFSRKMAPVEGEGAVWLHGLTAISSKGGDPFMFAHFTRLRELEKTLEHGLVRYNDETQTFDKWVRFDKSARLYPRGVSLAFENDVRDFVYYCNPFPTVRVPADAAAIVDPSRYEAFTCLKPGSTFDATKDIVDRNQDGNVVWGGNAIPTRSMQSECMR